MPGTRRLCLVSIMGFALPLAPAGADDPSLQDVLDRVNQLERDNAQLRTELDEVKARHGDTWLTEERAREIRALVGDVLADADARASLLQSGLQGGWDSQSGFFLTSPDGRYKLIIDGQTQFRWVYNYHDQIDHHVQGFENTRTKLTFRGNVFSPDLTYLVRGQFSRDGGGGNSANADVVGGEFKLQDSWIAWAFNNEWRIRFGQFKLPFNREELVSSQYQLAVERSLVNESLNLGRTQGIELQYQGEGLKVLLMTSEGADDSLGQAGSIVGGTPANTPALDADTEYAVTSRIEGLIAGTWPQFEDFTSPQGEEFGLLWGAAAHYQEDERNGAPSLGRNEDRWLTGTADLSAEWGGANAFGAFTYTYVDSAASGIFDFYGLVLQGGLYITPKSEIFTRFEYGRLDGSNVAFSDLYVITFGTNYYLDGHDAKWTTDIGFGLYQIEGVWASNIAGYRADSIVDAHPQIVFRTQFQLLF